MTDRPHTFAALSGPVIPLVPAFVELTGDVLAALLLRHLIYRSHIARIADPGAEWIPAERDRVMVMLKIARSAYDTARRRLKALGVVHEDIKGFPAILHIRIDHDALEARLSSLAPPASAWQPTMEMTPDPQFARSIQIETGGSQFARSEQCGQRANPSNHDQGIREREAVSLHAPSNVGSVQTIESFSDRDRTETRARAFVASDGKATQAPDLAGELAALGCTSNQIADLLAANTPAAIRRYLADMPEFERAWPSSKRGQAGEAWNPGRTIYAAIKGKWDHPGVASSPGAAERNRERETAAANRVVTRPPGHTPARRLSADPATPDVARQAVAAMRARHRNPEEIPK